MRTAGSRPITRRIRARDNLSFEDKGRKGGVIEMFDDTRAMWIRIDLNTRRIFWSTNGKKSWNYIYNITSAK